MRDKAAHEWGTQADDVDGPNGRITPALNRFFDFWGA